MANLWHQNSKNWPLCMQYDWRLGPTNSQTEHCCLPFSTWKFSLTGPEFMTKLMFQSSTQIHQTRQIQKNPLCRWVSKICGFKSNRICRDGALVILQLKKITVNCFTHLARSILSMLIYIWTDKAELWKQNNTCNSFDKKQSRTGIYGSLLKLSGNIFITKNSYNVPMKHFHIVPLLFSRLFLS